MAYSRETNFQDSFTEDNIDLKYKCPVCLDLMIEAMQTCCGHRACKKCIQQIAARAGNIFKCHLCRKELNLNEVFADKKMREEILSLRIKCKYANDGCGWTGEYHNRQDHIINECDHTFQQCKYCHKNLFRRKHLAAHHNSCILRPVVCEYCGNQCTFQDLERHQSLECGMIPVYCDQCGKGQFFRQDLSKHQNQNYGECPCTIVKCPYSVYDCHFTSARIEMSDHKKEFVYKHLDFVQEAYKQQTKAFSNTIEFMKRNQEKEMKMLKQTLSKQQNQIDQLQRQIKTVLEERSENEQMSDSENKGTVELQKVTAIDMDVNTEDSEIATPESGPSLVESAALSVINVSLIPYTFLDPSQLETKKCWSHTSKSSIG